MANRSRVYEAQLEEPSDWIARPGPIGVFIVRVRREQRLEPAVMRLAKAGEEFVKRSMVNVFKTHVQLVCEICEYIVIKVQYSDTFI